LAVTGAFAAAAGATSVEPTWAAAAESVTCCGASWALATAGANASPSAAAATAQALRIIWMCLSLQVCVERRNGTAAETVR
jgi:hypothetical protein